MILSHDSHAITIITIDASRSITRFLMGSATRHKELALQMIIIRMQKVLILRNYESMVTVTSGK